jgi:hypothetical protein
MSGFGFIGGLSEGDPLCGRQIGCGFSVIQNKQQYLHLQWFGIIAKGVIVDIPNPLNRSFLFVF